MKSRKEVKIQTLLEKLYKKINIYLQIFGAEKNNIEMKLLAEFK